MSEDLYDVIVVGGGPAGGSAAYFLGEAGKRVLVLEKETLPRYKTCGGGLSIQFLQDQFPFSFEPILQTRVEALSWAWGDQVTTIPIRPGVIGMVMRDQLDSFILSHARAEVCQGAAVRSVTELEDRVVVETQDGARYAGRYLIGADGANSVVAHSLGLRRNKTLIAAIEAEVPASPELMERYGRRPVFIFNEIQYGYLWIFPKADHLSVGIAALHPKHGELQAKLREVMARYEISLEGASQHGHPIPIYTHGGKIVTRRCLLAGDAAGLVDPLSGEGIRLAIKSGHLAAEAIIAGNLHKYPAAIRRKIGLNHTATFKVGRFFYAFQKQCLWLGATNPFSSVAVADVLSDRLSTPGLMFIAIATLPIYLITEVVAGFASMRGGEQAAAQVRASIYPDMVNYG